MKNKRTKYKQANNNKPTIVFETDYFVIEKKQVLVRFKPKTFAVLDLFVTSNRNFEFIMKQGTPKK